MKIITTHVYPPIPIRQFDWQANYEGEEDERMDIGWGATEAEAIAELLENHPRCKNKGGYVGTYGECLICDAETGIACDLNRNR